jgi:hypothetical protein
MQIAPQNREKWIFVDRGAAGIEYHTRCIPEKAKTPVVKIRWKGKPLQESGYARQVADEKDTYRRQRCPTAAANNARPERTLFPRQHCHMGNSRLYLISGKAPTV